MANSASSANLFLACVWTGQFCICALAAESISSWSDNYLLHMPSHRGWYLIWLLLLFWFASCYCKRTLQKKRDSDRIFPNFPFGEQIVLYVEVCRIVTIVIVIGFLSESCTNLVSSYHVFEGEHKTGSQHTFSVTKPSNMRWKFDFAWNMQPSMKPEKLQRWMFPKKVFCSVHFLRSRKTCIEIWQEPKHFLFFGKI